MGKNITIINKVGKKLNITIINNITKYIEKKEVMIIYVNKMFEMKDLDVSLLYFKRNMKRKGFTFGDFGQQLWQHTVFSGALWKLVQQITHIPTLVCCSVNMYMCSVSLTTPIKLKLVLLILELS